MEINLPGDKYESNYTSKTVCGSEGNPLYRLHTQTITVREWNPVKVPVVQPSTIPTLYNIRISGEITIEDRWGRWELWDLVQQIHCVRSWGSAAPMQNNINNLLIHLEKNHPDVREEEIGLVLTPDQARQLSVSREYRQYIQGAPDALAAIKTDLCLAGYGLAPYFYGLRVRVEEPLEAIEEPHIVAV